MKELIKKIQANKRYLSLNNIISKSPVFKTLDIDALELEVKNLHATREIRGLILSKCSLDNIIIANQQEQATRSRIVEIWSRVTYANNDLDNSVKGLKDYLMVLYWDDVQKLRTKDERMTVINTALTSLIIKTNKLSNLAELAQVILDDIDKSSFSLKRLCDLISYKMDKNKEIQL